VNIPQNVRPNEKLHCSIVSSLPHRANKDDNFQRFYAKPKPNIIVPEAKNTCSFLAFLLAVEA
jgi:hypothetical protein